MADLQKSIYSTKKNHLNKNGCFPNRAYIVFLVLVAVSISLSYAHEIIKMAVFSNFGDFGSYYFYSKALSLNYNVYDLDEGAIEQLSEKFRVPPFPYPTGHSPIFLFLARSFTFFEYRLASIIWLLVLNILLFFITLIILRVAYEKIVDIDRKFIMTSSVFLVLSFHPLIENMHLGQINLLALFFVVLCLYFLNKKKYVISGVMLSLSILMKPFLGILLLFFLWKRCYRVFFSALISFIVLEALGIFLNGVDIYFKYLTVMKNYILTDNISVANLSLENLFSRVANLSTHPNFININASLAFTLSIILLLYLLYITKGRFNGLDLKFILEFLLFITFAFIASPVVHEHHYVFLYLPILFLWARLSKDAKLVPALLFIISFLLIGLRYSLVRFPIFNMGPLAIFSGCKLYGVIILFFLTAHMIVTEKSVKDKNRE